MATMAIVKTKNATESNKRKAIYKSFSVDELRISLIPGYKGKCKKMIEATLKLSNSCPLPLRYSL
jgi:hypothetical protein